jgi:hypothetical protein
MVKKKKFVRVPEHIRSMPKTREKEGTEFSPLEETGRKKKVRFNPLA